MNDMFSHGSTSTRGTVVDRNLFAQRLQHAIDHQGLTYEEAARRIKQYLPQNSRLSGVSIWQYAKGKSFPRRRYLLQAISRALDLDVTSAVSGSDSDPSVRPRMEAIVGYNAHVTDQCDGYARLFLNCRVPWDGAIKIIDLLAGLAETERQE